MLSVFQRRRLLCCRSLKKMLQSFNLLIDIKKNVNYQKLFQSYNIFNVIFKYELTQQVKVWGGEKQSWNMIELKADSDLKCVVAMLNDTVKIKLYI